MQQDILKIALRKFDQLSKKYDGFINVFVDDWRGFRFIFDTKDVRKCDNNCSQCPLYLLLKNEKDVSKNQIVFSPSLYLASQEDKKLFGPQNFLNCKTFDQYQQCFVNFLLDKSRTDEEINNEFRLIAGLKMVYAKQGGIESLEKEFKSGIIKSYRDFRR